MTVTRLRSAVALLVAAAFALVGAAVAPNVAHATNPHDGTKTCLDGAAADGSEWRKLEGAISEVTAREGYFIVETCVKAANEAPVYQDVEPATQVELTSSSQNGHGETQAISHVAVREVPYLPPTCEGFTYDFGTAVDAQHVNMSVKNLATGETQTFNWHEDTARLEGELTLDPRRHADWPSAWAGADVAIVWIQVHPFNYHWAGEIELGCDTPPAESEEPTLAGSVAVGECEADAPWIRYDVQLTPADAVLDDRTAELVLTDGANTETLELGELGEDGTLSGRTLWPGASVAEDGTPTGWPGWEQDEDGAWVETDGNFAWTRGEITATIVVNPDLDVALEYPPATPECDANPPLTEVPGEELVDDEAPEPTPDTAPEATPDTTPAAVVDAEPSASPSAEGVAADAGEQLPQTGADVLWIALGALLLIGAGAGVMVLRRRA